MHELRADKIIQHFSNDARKDPVAEMMTDWFDTFEYAVNNTDLLPGFEKQVLLKCYVIQFLTEERSSSKKHEFFILISFLDNSILLNLLQVLPFFIYIPHFNRI